MLILVRQWAEAFMKSHPDISIYTEGGGTATGVEALTNGTADICSASRPLRPEEIKILAEKFGRIGIGTLVAKDALSIYVNPQNPVQDLSLKQLKEIFTGRIRNWKELGGTDTSLIVISRPPNSGTYFYFREHVLNDQPYSPDALTLLTTNAIVNYIAEHTNAIGYGGLAYGKNVVHCRINSIFPSENSIKYDLYPISRYLYLNTIEKPDGAVKAFMDWVLTPAGQSVVEQVGYISIWQLQ